MAKVDSTEFLIAMTKRLGIAECRAIYGSAIVFIPKHMNSFLDGPNRAERPPLTREDEDQE